MSTAQLDHNRIILHTPFRLKDQVKALPGARWNAKDRHWHVPATPSAARAVVTALPEVQADEAVLRLADAQARVRRAKDKTDLPDAPRAKRPSWPHQRTAFWLMAALFGDIEIEEQEREAGE